MIILKIIFLFIAVLFTINNLTRIKYRQELNKGNFIFWAIGIVGFIVIQFKLYM
jgi:heme/copper-type cytochrome/quinol oxidase subunit 1